MRIPPEKHHIISEMLERYLRDPRPWGLADVAERHNALPLYSSWTGTIFLRTDGEFFVLDEEDDPDEFLPEQDEQRQLTALATASRRDAKFLTLLPDRTPTACDCEVCEGRGFLLVGEQKVDITCGECAGLGWREPRDLG